MSADVIIIGGGLAGLISALGLAKAGLRVTLVEKKTYPFHRVCGEYISNEVLPYLRALGIDLSALAPSRISRFQLSSPTGKTLDAKLDLGGFGLSRFTFDHYLYQLAQKQGATFMLQQTALEVKFGSDMFTVRLSGGDVLKAPVVLGAYGKRANLDRQLDRRFFKAHSPYIGVKYHLAYDLPRDLIALHNFKDGYAGISAIEEGRYCFCYLTTRQNLKQHGSIEKMERAVLCKNPHLRQVFNQATFLYEQPEVINEVSFATKTCIENHMLMCGDAAGMITPLCGNGMAIAIHSGKIATEQTLLYFRNGHDRKKLEDGYSKNWNKKFANRLRVGRTVQRLFGSTVLSEAAVGALQHLPPVTKHIMRLTHGQPF